MHHCHGVSVRAAAETSEVQKKQDSIRQPPSCWLKIELHFASSVQALVSLFKHTLVSSIRFKSLLPDRQARSLSTSYTHALLNHFVNNMHKTHLLLALIAAVSVSGLPAIGPSYPNSDAPKGNTGTSPLNALSSAPSVPGLARRDGSSTAEGSTSPSPLDSLPKTPAVPGLLRRANQLIDTPSLEAVGLAHGATRKPTPSPEDAESLEKRDVVLRKLYRRARDSQTAGGNARTGNTGDVDSGNINNIAGPDNTITNAGGNNVPPAGDTISGDAVGGRGRNLGPGGNAVTGDTGTANGGYVNNEAGIVNNTGPGNNAGDGGVSRSGEATGGVSY
ncbi:hypothetical protein EIP91_012280 [Steccherinum ochraceum]|uniref:Uncharacterized protein n=1 Tax=Steccherinum ochraceum TaxID=92696 RepID=A0A4R0RJ81_9APHY|nr:hypothetical protein EIP91_012280 [Steccherinum ochraceum]